MKLGISTLAFFLLILFQPVLAADPPRLAPGEYRGTFALTVYAGTDSALIVKNGVVLTFVDTGSINGITLYPDSGQYNCSGISSLYNPPGGGGIYHVTPDSIHLVDLAFHNAEFDWTLILNGAFGINFRPDSLIITQNDTKRHRYRYMNLARQITAVPSRSLFQPDGWNLFQNYPNPFNPQTTISFQVGSATNVSIEVFDLLGRQVASLIHERIPAGVYSVPWNGYSYTSGIYFCRIVAGNFRKTIKLDLVR